MLKNLWSPTYYHQQVHRHDLGYAEMITTVTSAFSTSKKTFEPSMTSSEYVITENRSILITMLTSVVLLVLSLVLVFVSRMKYGKNQYHARLVFTALLMSVCILYTVKLSGLLNDA